MRETGLTLERVGLEDCSLRAWLHDGLRQAGLPVICLETLQANLAIKTMPLLVLPKANPDSSAKASFSQSLRRRRRISNLALNSAKGIAVKNPVPVNSNTKPICSGIKPPCIVP